MARYSKQMKTDFGLTLQEYQDIVGVAKSSLGWVYDAQTGEYSATDLAELVAHSLDRDGWLDVEEHPLWDIAADLCIEAEGGE